MPRAKPSPEIVEEQLPLDPTIAKIIRVVVIVVIVVYVAQFLLRLAPGSLRWPRS